ncbi:VaFE repeat-containing surface-anchored protein [Corynebacterium vitaeruminis]|uniref:VaFE repeat-containing surface-anchored protein n=1 Tax=Corynebacterium vitaeruminis TaxID=38305 RepID=UPI0028B0C22E|nr:VaFE repeat-containing surface-anchored protein [Corynebacterium vitaeruminis]
MSVYFFSDSQPSIFSQGIPKHRKAGIRELRCPTLRHAPRPHPRRAHRARHRADRRRRAARADSTYEAYTSRGFFNVRPLGQDAAEIAYCMNVHFALPRTQRSGESLPQFSRIDATGDFASYTEKKGEGDLDSKLLTILWNGAPNDALGLVDSGVLTADELRRVTQKSLWYYTDGHISQGLLDGTSESAKLYRQMTHQARAGEEMTLAEYPSDAVLYVYTPNDSATRWQTLLGASFRHPSTGEVIVPREASFSVEKRDAATQETLPGASLQLRSAAGDTYAWDSAATKENLQLAPGEYQLSETAAPASYEQPGTAPLATVTIAEDGTVTLGKHSPLVALEGKTLVVNNKKQSQPTLVTNAYDAAGGERDNLLPSTGGQVADMLTYTGLEAGKSYVVRGQLVDKATGQPTGVEKQETFVAETADGSYTVTFDVPASLAGTLLVAYEAIYAADDESHVVVQHADRDSAAQTVLVDSPEIPASITTKASVTGDSAGNILPASEKEGFGWVIPLAIGGALIGGALLAGSAVSPGSSGSSAPAGSAAADASSAAPASSQAPVEAAATSAPAPTPTSPAVRLATTGASVLGILGISVALIIGGALVIARCRKG